MYLDSMRQITAFGFSWPVIEPYNLERVEILHGPASVLYGQASPGGVVDMVSKRPTEDPYHEMFLSTGSYGRIQGGVDLSGPIDPNDPSKQWLYRFTASGLDVGSQVADTRYERVSVAPAVTWHPDADTKITFLGTYQNDPMAGFFNQLPAGGYGTLFPLPNGQHIPTSLFTGDPSDKMSRELVQGGYLAEHSFNNVWTVRQNLRYSDLSSDITTIYPFAVSSTNPYDLTRGGFFENDRLRTFDIDNQVEAKFALGPVLQTMLFGLDYQTGTFGYTAGASTTTPAPINVLNPVYQGPIPMTATSKSQQSFDQLGFYAQDQIKFDHWVALLGVRWDQADSSTESTALSANTTTNTQLSNDATTKRAALLYKFDNGVAPYIQYTESFQPTTGTDFSGNPFKPTTGQQEEAGIKYQPNPKSLYTLAVFNLVQQNVLTPDPNPAHVGFNVQTGEIRSRGVELEGKTEIDRSLSLLASYTYLDQVITQSNVPDETGRHPYGIPANSAAAWADYTFHSGRLDGFGLAGGVRYIGESTGNITGPTVLEVPGVTLFDAAVHYDFSALGAQYKGLLLQVNASNLFDKIYVSQCSDYGCFYGLRRQVIATLRYRW
jgi:iron complex outermembrane recepter protein